MDEKLNDAINKLVNEIKEPIEEINNFQFQRIAMIDKKIENIIKNNISDKNEIEKTLDILLDIAYWNCEMMLQPFNKLIDYYKKIDENSSKEYKKSLKEIEEEE